MDCQWQYAKNHCSNVGQKAQSEGPQQVTVRGERMAVVLSAKDYDALRAGRATIVDDLLSGPNWDDELSGAIDVRSKAPSRDVAF